MGYYAINQEEEQSASIAGLSPGEAILLGGPFAEKKVAIAGEAHICTRYNEEGVLERHWYYRERDEQGNKLPIYTYGGIRDENGMSL